MVDDDPLPEAIAEFEAALSLAKKVKEEMEHFPIANHLDKDENDQCGYCGQHFGPEDVVVEKEIYGRKWRFCDEQCLHDFLDASNFTDSPEE